jgi:16S rRNA (cytidine1402-2'-O)-methyltransferase
MLFIVATPIGNLSDITLRAIETFKQVDYILAEDTRRTLNLLRHLGIEKRLESYNEHSQYRKNSFILQDLKAGKNIALVSDAGTPIISDTGRILVSECIKGGIKVVPVPGANAAITALTMSGFEPDDFCFVGFLDKKEAKKKKLFEEMKSSERTYIFYESPYRLVKTLKAMSEMMPEKKVCICREMTKKFEEFAHGSAKELFDRFSGKSVKGELTIVVGI